MKKKSLLITLVALTLLSSMLLSSILGVTKAEYFKTLSKKLDFQASPDLALQYALWDANGTGDKEENKKREWEDGVYKNSKSFSQDIVVGRNDAYTSGIYADADWARYTTVNKNDVLAYLDSSTNKNKQVTLNSNKYPEASNIAMSVDNFQYNGENIVYQIKLPVDETGYYLLNFQIDFRLKTTKTPDPWASEISGFYTQHYDRAIGCEILNHDDGFTFRDSSKPLDLYTRSQNDTVYYKSQKTTADKQQNRTFEADSLYQWKTLAPSRAEKVSLAFKVEQQDVDKGYVIWMWDLAGLYGARTWRMEFTNLSVEKTMELNGSTKTRNSSVDPYFMFPQTSFMNNQYMLSLTNSTNEKDYDYPYYINTDPNKADVLNGEVRSVEHQGKVSYSKGRGTFATAATANSLTFQAESLFFGFDDDGRTSATENYPGTTTKLKYQYLDEDDDAAYSNPVAVYIPLKNIQFDTDYKVTFDLSVARQGRYGIRTPSNSSSTNGTLGNPDALQRNKFYGYDDADDGFGPLLVDYANPLQGDTVNLQNQIFRKGEQLFSSYLYSGDPSVNRNENAHRADGFTQITYANKTYQGEPLTKYDEINSLSSFQHSVTQSVNNTYNNAYSQSGDVKHKSESRNWFNAVLHTEYNAQNEIHWLTFYNTTFSFNIDGNNENNKSKLTLDENGFIQDLNWVWAMDSLISGCYYRIKLENVRIEKVVKYTSSLHPNGIMIAGTQIDPALHTVASPTGNSLGYDATEDFDDLYDVVDTFRSFRGINGTGQNWQAKGFVLDAYTDSKVLTSEGNIYAPIIDASKFTVRPNDTTKSPDANGEYPPTANAYKIALSGFAVCEGGVEKYVFSVDGGLTWHDMTFSGTNATTEPDPEDDITVRNQLVLASRGVNQYVSGQTRYNANNFSTAGLDISDYTHYNFTEADGANANFSNFALVADLSDYKNDANLDVIIAAVPTENINYRCEILRIINFNQIKNYVNFPYDFVSDITVNNKDEGPSLLNAFRLDESHLPDKQKPHYYNGLAKPEAIGFTMTKIYSLSEKRAQSTTAYARMGAISYDYEDIKTAFSDFPIYNELSITGWAIVEGGVQNYYWSADHGKTWTKCSGTAVKYTNSTNNDLISPGYADHFYSELGKKDPTIGKEKHRFEDSLDGNFSGSVDMKGNGNYSGTKLTADLSNYVGEVVDVIFAAKPNESDIYVPVGRIDNVGVYGANGTFYSRVHKVFIDGRTNDDLSNVSNTTVTPDLKDLSNEDLNLKYKWGLGYSSEMCYVIYEPQNVNPINSRYISKQVQTIKSGGRVTIDGYVMCKGGVERYKYSLDGGVTWTVINDEGTKITKSSMINYCKSCDNSFTSDVDDGLKGDFCCTTSDTTYTGKQLYDHALEFNIPALKDGTERDLLVVAEGKYNKNIPVLHMKIRVQGGTKYGYHNIAGLGTYGVVQGGYFTGEQSLKFTPTQGSRVINRITIPVTEEGDYQLTFNHRIQGAQNSKNAKIEISFVHDEGEYTYFCDRTRQFTSIGTNKNANSDHIYTIPDASKNEDYRAITASVSVTEADVKRGYIVLDINYNNLTLETEYTATINLSEDALVKKTSGFLFDMPLMTAPTGYGNAVFMNTVTTAGNYELSVNPILNPPIYKGPFNNLPKFSGAYLSVPKTYFTVGEPITVDYYSKGFTNKGFIYITSDQICNPGRYGDLYIKRAQVAVNTKGRVEFTAAEYDLGDDTYTNTANGNVTCWRDNFTELNRLRSLPAGEYKIYFIDNTSSFDPYNVQRDDSGLVIEPITIKVIDPENPDLSIALYSDIPYGINSSGNPDKTGIPTEIILDRVVYEKGENVYFKINGSWVRNWVAILKHDVFTGGSASENKVGTWSRYAEHGTYDSIVTKNGNNNYLQTDTLEPGQYKIVYLFGLTVEGAWNHDKFAVHNNSLSKIMAIIDITILPEGTLQQHTVTYTKANGQQGKIDLVTNTLAHSIQTPTYTVVEVSSTEITDIMKNAAYSSTQGANYGTAASLKYRFGSYTVRPAEVTYTLTVPADIDNSTCNVAYYTTLENSGASKKFNILCPTYIFRKKSS